MAAASLACSTSELSDSTSVAGVERASEPLFEQRDRALAFTPCEAHAELECGTLEVPADYSTRDANTLRLHVVRARATGERIGPLVVNFGGPGTQTDILLRLVAGPLAPLRERFDLIAFDPRGTPGSDPEVHCDFEPPPAPAAADSAARADYLDEYSRRFTAACGAQTGPVVTTLSSNNNARDLEMLRKGLGEHSLSLWTASYGTLLGTSYVSMFPHRVRALVLDGSMPDTLADYTTDLYAESAAAAELALERLDELCRSDSHCPLYDMGIVAGVQQVLAALRTAPVSSSDGTKVIDEAAAGRVINSMLLIERWFQPQLPSFVQAALRGDYAKWFDLIAPDDISSSADLQMRAVLMCNDFGSRHQASDFLPKLEAVEALYPVGRYSDASVLFRTCQAWPPADVPILRNVADQLRTPALLIGNEFDPSTPWSWTIRTAHALGVDTSVLRYEGGGHTASFSGDPLPCIDRAALHYLVELALPPPGASCPAAALAFEQ